MTKVTLHATATYAVNLRIRHRSRAQGKRRSLGRVREAKKTERLTLTSPLLYPSRHIT